MLSKLRYFRLLDDGGREYALSDVALADLKVMFAFFSNRLGCTGSLIVSMVGSLVFILVLRGCGGF
jgi:hypothetical protein